MGPWRPSLEAELALADLFERAPAAVIVTGEQSTLGESLCLCGNIQVDAPLTRGAGR
jgi:hypothetical protein